MTNPAFVNSASSSLFIASTKLTIILIANANAKIRAASPRLAPVSAILTILTNISMVRPAVTNPLNICSHDKSLTLIIIIPIIRTDDAIAVIMAALLRAFKSFFISGNPRLSNRVLIKDSPGLLPPPNLLIAH